MLSIAIVEDDSEQARSLKEILRLWAQDVESLSEGISINTFSNGADILACFKTDEYNVIFLDIELGGKNGMKLAKQLREQDYTGFIIFTTSHQKYAIEGYEVDAFRYLLKPISERDIKRCMDQIMRKAFGSSFCFTCGGITNAVPYADIMYFESDKHYVTVGTATQNFTFKHSLKEIQKSAPYNFVRCHKSFIINLDHIKSITGEDIFMSNGKAIPVARKYVASLRAAISENNI